MKWFYCISKSNAAQWGVPHPSYHDCDGPCIQWNDGENEWYIDNHRIDTHERFTDYLMLTIAKLMTQMVHHVNNAPEDNINSDHQTRLIALLLSCTDCGIEFTPSTTARAISVRAKLSTGWEDMGYVPLPPKGMR